MLFSTIFTVFLLAGASCAQGEQALNHPVRIASWNVNANSQDKNAHVWWRKTCNVATVLCRRPYAAKIIKSIIAGAPKDRYDDEAPGATIFGLQGLTGPQMQDLRESLDDTWRVVGAVPDGEPKETEYNPILYQAKRFNIMSTHMVKLPSLQLKIPERSLTVGVFQDARTGNSFIVANTRLDPDVREMEIPEIISHLSTMFLNKEQGVVLLGSFGGSQGDIIYNKLYTDNKYKDIWEAPVYKSHTKTTHTSFKKNDTDSRRNDYIWLAYGVERLLKVAKVQVEDNKYKVNKILGKVTISDHRPVVADFTIM